MLPTIGPNDVGAVHLSRDHSVAFYANTPVRVQEAHERIQGMLPRSADPRIVPMSLLGSAQLATIDHARASADRVFLIDSSAPSSGAAGSLAA